MTPQQIRWVTLENKIRVSKAEYTKFMVIFLHSKKKGAAVEEALEMVSSQSMWPFLAILAQ